VRERGWPAGAEAHLWPYVARATPTLINQLPPEVDVLPRRG
jgi:hypothetical protein